MHGSEIPDSELFRVLRFVRDFREEKGVGPTTREMVTGLALSSSSVAQYRIDALLHRGWMVTTGQARSMRPTDAGLKAAGLEDCCPCCGQPFRDEPTVRVHATCVKAV
jgi:SOS-response transcriptional repressor LexA